MIDLESRVRPAKINVASGVNNQPPLASRPGAQIIESAGFFGQDFLQN